LDALQKRQPLTASKPSSHHAQRFGLIESPLPGLGFRFAFGVDDILAIGAAYDPGCVRCSH